MAENDGYKVVKDWVLIESEIQAKSAKIWVVCDLNYVPTEQHRVLTCRWCMVIYVQEFVLFRV